MVSAEATGGVRSARRCAAPQPHPSSTAPPACVAEVRVKVVWGRGESVVRVARIIGLDRVVVSPQGCFYRSGSGSAPELGL